MGPGSTGGAEAGVRRRRRRLCPGLRRLAFPIHHWLLLAGCFCLAGAGIGLAETAESTLVAQLLPDRLRGSGFGLLGGLQSAGDFLSSTIVGLL